MGMKSSGGLPQPGMISPRKQLATAGLPGMKGGGKVKDRDRDEMKSGGAIKNTTKSKKA